MHTTTVAEAEEAEAKTNPGICSLKRNPMKREGEFVSKDFLKAAKCCKMNHLPRCTSLGKYKRNL